MPLQDDAKLSVTLAGDGQPGLLPGRTVAAGPSQDRISAGHTPVDGYQVIGRLGSGGMGTVWRAWQLSARREVALKLLNHGAIASERSKRRFDREVELTARLSHPNIARLYDSGVHNGACYYAMELIDGLPLDEHVHQHQPSVRKILEMLETTCHAVQHAHQHGVIHRDLKPSNIIVDAEGRPHVLDFGVAKVFEVNDAGSAVSIEGEVLGTPAFMSPEQAAGKGDAVDTRSDVYSLGVILYLLLTGRTPHDTSGTYLEILRRVSENEIVRPRKACARVDAELEAILLKTLARDVEARYSSAGALAEDLRNYLTGEPLNARRRTAFYFLRKKVWKHRIPAAAAVAVALSLAGLTIYGSIRITNERDLAVASAAKEREALRLSQLRLGENLLVWGDTLASTERWEEARKNYWEARDISAGFHVSTTAVDLALIDSYLHAPLPLNEFGDPGGQIFAIGFGPDGRTGYCAGAGGVTTSWDLPSGRKLSTRGDPHGVVQSAAFTSDTRRAVYVLSADPDFSDPRHDDGEQAKYGIQVQDILNDAPPRRLPMRGRNPTPIALSPDGALVALTEAPIMWNDKPTWTGDVVVCRLDGDADSTVIRLVGGSGYCAFSGDGTKLMLADQVGRLTAWKLAGGQLLSRSPLFPDIITAIAPARDADAVLVGGHNGSLSTWTATGQRIREFAGHHPVAVTKVAMSPNGAWALSGDNNGQVKLWNAATGSLLSAENAHNLPVKELEFSTDGQLASSAAANGTAKLWQINDRPDSLAHLSTWATSLAMSPDGTMVAAGLATGEVMLLDVATGKLLQLRAKSPPPAIHNVVSPSIESIAFTADGRDLCFCHAGCVDRLQVLDFAATAHFQIAPNTRNTTLLTPDARFALNFGRAGASILDSTTGKQLSLLDSNPVQFAALSADGKVALISQAGQLRLIQVATAKEIAPVILMPTHGEGREAIKAMPSSCALSADGRLAIIGDALGDVLLWDPFGTGLYTLGNHPGAVGYVDFAPDQHLAVSGGDDGTLKLWDLDNKRELRVLNRGEPLRAFAAFGKDSRLIFSRPEDDIRLLDPTWPLRYRNFALRLPQALQSVAARPQDPEANALLGEWYAFRGQSRWAADLLERARAGGVDHSGLDLARCYWKLGDFSSAAREFNKLLRSADSPELKLYLTLCRNAAAQGVSDQSVTLGTTKPAPPARDDNAK